MREHFTVGVGLEDKAARLERRLEGGRILDNAVVHDGDRAVHAHMRVRVLFRRRSMRRPPRVRDPHRAEWRLVLDHRLKTRDLASGAKCFHTFPVHDRDARRVVAAIFEALQSVDEHGGGNPSANVAYDSTHVSDGLEKSVDSSCCWTSFRVVQEACVLERSARARPLPSDLRQ